MTIAATYRWKVADVEETRKWSKVANGVWTRAGATAARGFFVMVGPNVGNFIAVFEFPDVAAYGKARAAVRSSPEFKEWTAAAAKVGNVLLDVGLLEEIAA